MAPHELRRALVKQLGETRNSMLELAYLIALEKLSPAKQKAAALQLSHVQVAYLRMRAAELADIRDQLKENDEDLQKGIASLQSALKSLHRVEAIVGATASLLKIVGRVVAL